MSFLERIEDKLLNSEGLPQARVPDYRETLSEPDLREENRRLRAIVAQMRLLLDKVVT